MNTNEEKKEVYLVYDADLKVQGHWGEEVEAISYLKYVTLNKDQAIKSLKELISKDRLMNLVVEMDTKESFDWSSDAMDDYVQDLLYNIEIQVWDLNTEKVTDVIFGKDL